MIGIGPWELLILLLLFPLLVLGAILLVVVVVIKGRNRSGVPPKTQTGHPRLVRIPQQGTIGGVCAGFAYKFGIPVWLVRVSMVLLIPFSGISLIGYPILWVMMPKASELPEDYDTRTERI